MQGLDIKLAHTTTATTAKDKTVSINLTGVILCGGIAHYGKTVIDMRLIDADELMEHVFRDKLDSRELIAKMVENAPTVATVAEIEKAQEQLKAHIEYLSRQNNTLKGEIKALAFAVKCNGVSGNEVRYEVD